MEEILAAEVKSASPAVQAEKVEGEETAEVQAKDEKERSIAQTTPSVIA